MEVLLKIIIFISGLCFGSFVNMLVYRVAISYKLIKPPSSRSKKGGNRSYCDYCGKQLKWYENIPVISWIFLKGKTKCCQKKLSVLYPIVELVTGILFLLNFQLINFQLTIQFFLSFLIIVFLVFSGVFDLKYMILPDFSTIVLIVCALILWSLEHLGDWNYIISSIISYGFLGFLYLITKKKGMGFGDVKLAVFMGLLLGYPKIIVAFYIAFVVGAVVSLFLIIFKKAGRKTQIPFGPFLILGTFFAWWWGDYFLKFVFSI